MSDLINEWRWQWGCWVGSEAQGADVSLRNSLMDRIRVLSAEIAEAPELHERIERLCTSENDADTRVRAALVREHWDAIGSAATLVDVIESSGAAIARPVTMAGALGVQTTSSARTAALCLLNIDSGRGNTGSP
jgi:hypothetical protein